MFNFFTTDTFFLFFLFSDRPHFSKFRNYIRKNVFEVLLHTHIKQSLLKITLVTKTILINMQITKETLEKLDAKRFSTGVK